MSKPWDDELNKKDLEERGRGKWIAASLKVLAEPAYDVVGDAIVDVDYRSTSRSIRFRRTCRLTYGRRGTRT